MFSAGGSEVTSDNSQSFDALDEDSYGNHNNNNHNSINNSSINSTSASSMSILNTSSVFNQTPWHKMPEMSLLDLAFKLKQAEMRIFGRDRRSLDRREVELNNSEHEETKDIKLNSDLYYGIEPSAKRALLEINEKYRQLEASFPRNLTGEEFPNRLVEPSILTPGSPKVSEAKARKRFGCGWCGYNTDSKSHLHRHHKAMHKDRELKILTDPELFGPPRKPLHGDVKRKHQCDMCSYQTDCKSHLRRHQGSVHCKDKLYECPICKIEFSRSEKAKEHHFAFHPEKAFDIRNMRKPLLSESGRSNNQDKMDKIRQLYENVDYLVNISKQGTVSNNSLNFTGKSEVMAANSSDDQLFEEPREVNAPNITGSARSRWTSSSLDEKEISDSKKKSKLRSNNAFVCLKCDYSCRDLWHLRRHVLDVHSSNKDHNCKVCHYATNRHHRLFCHMLKHGELFCNYCDFSSTNPEVYKLHFQVCSIVQKVTKCSVCSRDFDDFASYKEHVTGEHIDLIVNCPKCQFFTESSKELQTHLGLHIWEDRICRICYFMAEDDESFSQHCCDQHFTYDADWTQSWICMECGKGEADRENAVAHITSHLSTFHDCQKAGCSFRCRLEQCLDLHLKYMHQVNDGSLTSYLDQLDTQMSKSSNKESEVTKYTKEENVSPIDKTDTDPNLDTEQVETIVLDSSTENVKDDSEPSLSGSSPNTEASTKPVCQSHSGEFAFPNFRPASPDEELLIVNPTTASTTTQSSNYLCPHCPERPAFRYKKSFEKHMTQHAIEQEDPDHSSNSSGSEK